MLAGLLFERLEKQARPAVAFAPERCLRSRLHSNDCESCLAHCPNEALMLDGRKIVFRPKHCTSCLTCVTSCPNDAFSCDFDFSSLLPPPHDSEEEPLVFSCARKHQYARQVTVPCLGLLSEPILAALNCLAPVDFYLDTQPCAACDNRHVLSLLEERRQAIIKKNEPPAGLKMRPLTENCPPAAAGRQRRALLRRAGNYLAGLGGEAAVLLTSAGQPPAPDKEKKVMNKLYRLLQQAFTLLPEEPEKKKLLLAYFFSLKTNENCDICPLCTGMCPTGALKRRNKKDEKQLLFTSAKCSGCGLCVAFCKKKALALRPGAQHSPDTVLAIA